MIDLIIRTFVKDYKSTDDLKVREKYGILAGVMGIICNVLLFASKYVIGALTHSISVTADSFNNLSDAGSSVVTLIGFRISAKPPDREHPFGHGRMEYIASLIVSLLILLMGFGLLSGSVSKIITPRPLTFGWIPAAALALTILVKLWMAHYNRVIGRRISSDALLAVSTDSRNDMIATGAALTALITSTFTSFPVDGVTGALVALFIIYSGYSILRRTVGELLGGTPDGELVNSIEDTILGYDGIDGIHDFLIHSYGAGRCFATVHAEVSADRDILAVHDLIDEIERSVKERFNVELVIHMDPVEAGNERADTLRSMVEEKVSELDSSLSIHDFRVTDGDGTVTVMFDVSAPYEYALGNDELTELLREKIESIDGGCKAVIYIDRTST